MVSHEELGSDGRIVVLLSGGVDSATALASLGQAAAGPRTLFVDYGQDARTEERSAARGIAAEFGARHREIRCAGLSVPEGEIPGRNALLVLLGFMELGGEGTIVISIHQGSGYWDCSPDFVASTQRILNGYAAGRVQLLAPFIEMGKPDIYELARDLAVPLDLTYSCERGGGPCGRCRSCGDARAYAGA